MKNEKLPSKPAFDPEVPPREGFIFYRTFYEALASMKNRVDTIPSTSVSETTINTSLDNLYIALNGFQPTTIGAPVFVMLATN